MIPVGLRKEFAVHSLRWWIPVSAAMGLWVALTSRQSKAVFGWIPLQGRPEGVVAMISMMWTAMAIHLLNAGFSERSSGRVDLALPLVARESWLSHMRAIVGSSAAIPLVTSAFIALGNAAFGRRPLFDPGLVSIMVNQTVVTVLLLMLAQSPKPGLRKLRPSKGYVSFLSLAFLGSIALVYGLNALPLYWTLVPLGVALLAGARIFRSLPRSFTLVPREVGRATTNEAPAADAKSTRDPGRVAGAGRGFWLECSTIWRNSLGNWTWLYLPVFLFYGGALALMIELDGWHNQAVPMIFWTCLLLCCWILVAHNKLYILDGLPISRRRVFAVLMLPAFVLVALVYAGVSAGVFLAGAGPRVDFRDAGGHRCVVVPNQYWEIAWDGRLPEYESPQGEMVAPCCGQRLLPGHPAVVYKPYHTPAGASLDLVAWQLGRAVEVVHGQTVPQERIRERYLVRGEDGGVVLSAEGRDWLESLPPARPSSSASVFPVVFVLFGFPALVFAALGYRVSRSTAATGFARWLLAGVFIAAIGAGIVTMGFAAAGVIDLRAGARFAGSLVRSIQHSMPGGALSLWALALLLMLAGYLAAQSAFLRLEVAVAREKK